MKPRVIASLGLMFGAKAVNVSVPFLFKNLVDNLNDSLTSAVVAVDPAAVSTMSDTISALPPSIAVDASEAAALAVIGYGGARATASLLNESRNAVFAHVSQSAIRNVGSSTFKHLHNLDLSFHLNKNTGTVTRILDRGNRSISFVLNAMVFNVMPTAIEVGVVSGLMYHQVSDLLMKKNKIFFRKTHTKITFLFSLVQAICCVLGPLLLLTCCSQSVSRSGGLNFGEI